jgi:hypothetical protein
VWERVFETLTATRYDRRTIRFRGFALLAASMIWMA